MYSMICLNHQKKIDKIKMADKKRKEEAGELVEPPGYEGDWLHALYW
jgi:hypothetical protein